MRRLTPPGQDRWQTTIHSAAKFIGTPYLGRIENAQAHFEALYNEYENAAAAQSWYHIASCAYGQGDQIIFADVTKDDLKKLYDSGMVRGAKEARDVYDEIKIAAQGRCPFCGGLGHVGGLDHYLPKSRYPAFAVLPVNLIPCCEKCNSLSGSPVFSTEESQTLNPYFDNPFFFNESWISVEFEYEDIKAYRYVFDPPDGWSAIAIARAERHFRDYHLAVRYGTAASAEVGYLADLKSRMVPTCTKEIFQNLLLTKANTASFDLNGWQRPLYRALANWDWFLEDFA